MKRFIRTILILTITCVLSGCGITTISPQDRATLKIITLDQNVSIPSYLSFSGDGSQYVQGMFGIIGLYQAGKINQSDSQTIQSLMISNHIDIQSILLGAMRQQLSQAGYAVVPNSPNVMSLTVTQYGFVPASKGIALHDIHPTIMMSGKLLNNSRTIWQNSAIVSVFSDFPSYSMADFKNNPELLRQVWAEASQRIAISLVKTISQ